MADIKREQLIAYAKGIHDYCEQKYKVSCEGCPFEWRDSCLLMDSYRNEVYSPADWCLDE